MRTFPSILAYLIRIPDDLAVLAITIILILFLDFNALIRRIIGVKVVGVVTSTTAKLIKVLYQAVTGPASRALDSVLSFLIICLEMD